MSVAVFEEKARALAGLKKGARGVRRGPPIPEYVDRQGRSTAHRAFRNGVAVDAARPVRAAQAQGTITR
jgi:hypothetical protein